MRRLKGKRTILFNILTSVAVPLLAFDWSPFFSDQAVKWILLANLIGNIWLRFLTDTPVMQAEKE